MRIGWIGLMLFFLSGTCAVAEISLNGLFADNMVLQRNAPVSIYGRAEPQSRVIVKFSGQTRKTVADASGNWELKLEPMPASDEPADLTVTAADGQKVVIKDVLVGDVWLCGGQSNMAHAFKTFPLLLDRLPAINNRNIRSRIIENKGLGSPSEEVVPQKLFETAWQPACEPWVSPLSPTAYYFAEALNRELDIPIGLIVSAVGGSQIQRWMPRETVLAMNLDVESNDGAGALYNGMIHPLRKFTLKGVIWYQGESNGKIPHSYYALSKRHIECWREIWAQNNPHLKEMPFLTVQIAPFKNTVDGLAPDAWAYVRDAQRKTLELPNTGLAVISDLGEFEDIHPQDKQPVGERLALWALRLEGRDVEVSGPLFEKAEFENGAAKVYFTHVSSGLETRRVAMSSKRNVWAKDDPGAYVVPADTLAGFSLCGADRVFFPAEAVIAKDHVVVSCKEVPEPVAVRYGWSTFPLCNLFNKAGLPASPFRSDDFPVPDVQGRKAGEVWNRDEASLGSKMEFLGSTAETEWSSAEADGLTGRRPAKGQDGKPKYGYYKRVDGPTGQGILSIVYFDDNTGAFEVQYDSSDEAVKVNPSQPGAWKSAGKVKLNNTGKWVVVKLPLNDALFSGRCNGGDIRISLQGDLMMGGAYFQSR